jgi:FG-GAP repeat
MTIRLFTAFLIVLGLLPATASAAAPSCPDDNADELGGSGEVFGVGPRYVIAGVPQRAQSAGAIVVRDGNHTPRAVTLASVQGAGAPAAGDRFGAALASGMLVDGRPCTDLLAGAPGRGGTGEAYLLFGSTGASPRAANVLRAPDAAPGDEFGAAVAISDTTEDSQFPGHDLWIGAPGRDIAGQTDAGAIYHYAISTAGAITYAGVTTQGAGAEAGDRLGEVLAPIAGGVLAGVPHEDAGTRRDAGGLLLVRSGGGTRSAAGTHAGDRLGAAVADTGLGILAGAPGAAVRGRRDAGLVVAYKGTLARRRTYRQGAHGVPGRAEAGDRFGSALATGMGIRCQEEVPIAIGVPGEDVGHARDAGAVTLLGDGDLASCRPRELTQGDGLSGRPHRRARIGATLGIAPDRPGLDEDEYDALLTGIPAGGILTLRGGYPALHGRLAAPRDAPRYGSVFALPS